MLMSLLVYLIICIQRSENTTCEMQIENKFIISTKYSVEGPLRMKEEYVEGAFESPKVNEEAVPEQLRGAFGQAFNTLQQLPVPIRDAVSSGMKVPLGKISVFL